MIASYPWYWQVVWEDGNLWFLVGGIKWTVALAASSFFTGLILAVPITVARLSRLTIARNLAYAYVEFFRTVPLLLGILWVYYALPALVPGLRLGAFVAAYLLFSLNIAAFVSEAYRAGLLGLPRGQSWAGLSLGMHPRRVFARILFPQAVRRVVPALGNIWVSLFKDTALVFVIAIPELTYRSNRVSILTYRQLEIFTATMILYFVITYPQARIVDRLYERYRTHE